jgi:hypothetical protein
VALESQHNVAQNRWSTALCAGATGQYNYKHNLEDVFVAKFHLQHKYHFRPKSITLLVTIDILPIPDKSLDLSEFALIQHILYSF